MFVVAEPGAVLAGVPVQVIQIVGMENSARGMRIKHHRKEDNTVTITFADTGCGISEKALPHIFDPFYQDTATT